MIIIRNPKLKQVNGLAKSGNGRALKACSCFGQFFHPEIFTRFVASISKAFIMNYLVRILPLIALLISSFTSFAQRDEQDTAYVFEAVYDVETTSVKDQHRSGTCWDFASLSFIESELIRAGKGHHDLSEMFIINRTYPRKAEFYVRYHGKSNFGPGGQGHDAIYVIEHYGIVPEEVYKGIEYGEEKHNHGELDAMLQGMLDAVVKKRGGKITPKWNEAVQEVVDVYLGEAPESFVYEGEAYTPKTYAESLGLDPEQYIELTSYTHHPFYEQFILEVPDNWSNDLYYNVLLDDLIKVMDHALEEGYTIMWDGDVSDKFFSHKDGVAIVPEKAWKDKTDEEKKNSCKIPEDQQEVDQQMRQKAFDSQLATDDHLMHIVGLYKDQHGVKYYKTKNSWDSDSNDFGGFLQMSEPYVRMNTIAIMVNKEALPKGIKKKLFGGK